MVNVSTISYATFISIFPEFDTVAQGQVEMTLDLSSNLWSKSTLVKFYANVVYLYTAHRLTLRNNLAMTVLAKGYRNPLDVGTSNNQSASNTSLSQGFTVSSMVAGENPWLADLARTTYGMEILSILYMIVPRGWVVS